MDGQAIQNLPAMGLITNVNVSAEALQTKEYLEAVRTKANTKGMVLGLGIGAVGIFAVNRWLAPMISEKMGFRGKNKGNDVIDVSPVREG